MRLMLVDDEERVLQGVARSLAAMGVTWQLAFAGSGCQALEELERAPADAVIADLRMPTMDGRALLREVHARWPRTFRILLCGRDDRCASTPLDGVHQFLVKPCDAIAIINAIERLHSLQSLLEAPVLREIAARGGLPKAPPVYGELVRCIGDTSAGESAGAVLNRHPGLLESVATSPLFLRGVVGESGDAVTRVGFERLLLAVLALEVFGEDRTGAQLSRRALLSALLGERVAAGRSFRRDGSIAALLCDVGLLIPDIEANCRRADARGEGAFTPADAGAYLLDAWGFPTPVVEAVAFHREPWRVHPREFGAVSAVYVASCLARNIEPSNEYLRRCGVLADLAGWKRFADELKAQSVKWHRPSRHRDVLAFLKAGRTGSF
jgi:DNA-binding NarL/FixJ family response regulator